MRNSRRGTICIELAAAVGEDRGGVKAE